MPGQAVFDFLCAVLPHRNAEDTIVLLVRRLKCN